MNTLQTLVDKLNEAMQAIQNLQMQPTVRNCQTVVKAYNALQAAAQIGLEIAAPAPKQPDAAPAAENVVRMPEGTSEKERQESQDALDGNPPCCGEDDI